MGLVAVRRRVWVCAAGVSVVGLALAPIARAGMDPAMQSDHVRDVDPFVGTAPAPGTTDTSHEGGGNTFPGPVLPAGMIQLGPDTLPASDNVGGGYSYSDKQIRGFSLRHMSGPGCANYRDVPITPTTEPITGSPVEPLAVNLSSRYIASFSHNQEAASPGYYRVTLNQPNAEPIDVRLTSALRSAVARFTYPASKTATVILNAGGSVEGDSDAMVRIDPVRHEVSGSASSGSFCFEPEHYKVYFVARFNRAFSDYGTWRKQLLEPGSTVSEDRFPGDPFSSDQFLGAPFSSRSYGLSAQSGAYATFDTTLDRTVEMRVAVSYVSVANARRNLEAETGGQSFDAVRARAGREWENALGRVQVRGGSPPELRRFYTALYQALIEPSTFGDVDGRYPGMDNRLHRSQGYTQYADFSGWDVYRSQMPLLAILRPTEASDVAQSLLADAQQSGWLPKWSVGNGHTEIMTGDPADPIIAGIYALGARGFATRAALRAMVKGATQVGRSANDGYVERQALPEYLRLGYVPHELNGNGETGSFLDYSGGVVPVSATADLALPWGSAGTTLEYATDDFAISQLARALGDTTTCRTFLRRSGNWRNVFNRATGYIEPRLASGSFLPSYNPNYNDLFSSQGFPEGDAAQYTWMIPYDPAGLFSALGGRIAAAKRLDTFFTYLNAGSSSPYAYLGNQPTENSPWLYEWLGQPYKTQQVLRRALLGLYPDTPEGFPGNDDMGELSSWYVLSALGLYPEIPGTDVLAVSSPLFPDVTLHLERADIRMLAPRAASDVPYLQSLRIDGRAYHQPWVHFSDLASGATLNYTLSTTPDSSWGASPGDAPPSFGPNDTGACQPVVR